MSSDPENVDSTAAVDATEADRINTGALGTLVVVGVLAMISITAAMTALVRHDLDSEQAQKATEENRVVTDLKTSQRTALNAPASYVDRDKGVVSLPIDVAKGLVVHELEHDPASATPPAPASAAPVQVTSATVDSSAAPAKLGMPGGPADPNQPAEPAKPEQGREVIKSTPQSSAKSPPPPRPTPTAATPGAEAPGPTKK